MTRRREAAPPPKVELPPEPVAAEPSDLEVQQMLEKMDREERKEPEPPAPLPPAAVVVPDAGQHPLDLAPMGSKIVVTEEGAVFASTADKAIPTVLPKSDPASRLPRGARINKTKDGFVAIQLDAAYPVQPKTYPTAGAAIDDFLAEFHERAPLRVAPKGNS